MIYDYLFDWQKKLVDKYKSKSAYGIFLDMGLGKTPISLALTEANNCDRLIIISINSKATESKEVEGSFLYWADKSYVRFENVIQKKLKKSQVVGPEPTLLVINYESLYDRKAKPLDLKPVVKEFIATSRGKSVGVIIDESHKMKDMQSLQTKAIMMMYKQLQVVSNSVHLYLLTGTPFTTGFIDLYTQLKILGCPLTKTGFTDAFCVKGHIPGLLDWQQPIVGYKNLNQLYELIHKFAITIKSEEVIDLPDKIFVDHVTKESDAFKFLITEKLPGTEILTRLKHYTSDPTILSDPKYAKPSKVNNPFFRNLAFPSLDWIADTAGTFWMRCRQLSIGFQGSAEKYQWYSSDRLDAVHKFLEDNPDNYVVFYNYTPELFKLFDIADDLGYNVDVYSGDLKSLDFYNRYEASSESDRLVNKKNLILANFASGSTGKNWQLYNKCILFSVPLFKDFEQGIKRIHRIGSKEPVIYHMFYENNWLDQSMKQSLLKQEQYNEDMFKADLKRINTEILN